jgi:hypothetical protein
MNPSDPQQTDGVIRISREEATSEHVDDLLRRQANMRGERGISRGGKARWYYKNWFVFMIVGGAAAVAAWALLEPSFNDHEYLQGEIREVNLTESRSRFVSGEQYLDLYQPVEGWIQIKEYKIWLIGGIKQIPAAGPAVALDRERLQPGARVGVYIDYYPFGMDDVIVGAIIVPDPPPQSPEREALTLSQMATRTQVAGLLLFPLIAGLIGLAIGAVDGLICRLIRRAVLAGSVGLLVGFIGGFVFGILAELIYAPLNMMAMSQMGTTPGEIGTLGFVIQMGGRALAWGMAGMAMGLGQGIALRSKHLLLYGFLGGLIGGLLGGLLFDPIDLLLLGSGKPSAHWSRLAGFAIIGMSVGAMIGVVELLTRDAWLRMIEGPLAGKEFMLFKDVMTIGSSPRSQIYLFNDAEVADHAATLRTVGGECEIESHDPQRPVLLNDRPSQRSRLRHGDRIGIGRTVFVFEKRQT